MSGQLKARDKVAHKMTKDGLVETNAATGESISISRREADLDFGAAAQGHGGFSQFGKSPQTYKSKSSRNQTYMNDLSEPGAEIQTGISQQPGTSDTNSLTESYTTTQGFEAVDEPPPTVADAQTAHASGTAQPSNRPGRVSGAKSKTSYTRSFAGHETSPQGMAAVGESTPTAADGQTTPTAVPAQTQNRTDIKPGAKTKSGESGRLQFTKDEQTLKKPPAQQSTANRKLAKAERGAMRTNNKLAEARDNLPTKRKLRKVDVLDENGNAVSRRLRFEKTPISQGEHIKGRVPLRPVKAAGNTAIAAGHRKLFQLEYENVGIKAAHRAEMLAEGGVRSALRFHKTAPYRKAAKLERGAAKKSINLSYRMAVAENPELQSNILKRAFQKRKIKKQYAKAAREAHKAAKHAKHAKKAGSATTEAGKKIVEVVKRHPIATTVIVLLALLVFVFMSLIGVGAGIGGGGLGGVLSASYLAGDSDMIGAEAAYAGMEAGLGHELDNYAALHPGYDEYIFELDDIGHDPYVLTSILCALHEGVWTLDEVQDTLAMLFERQYTLTESVATEVRYRTETTTAIDPATLETIIVTNEVAYNYYICTVTLENFDLSHLPVYIMGDSSLSSYALYMTTFGNRPDLFPTYQYPNASTHKEYGRHDIPPEYFEDEVFAAIMKEAQKYLGMPYVWGGSKPESSFDCSGYVSWVLNHSGWDVGRLGARGLYAVSTPVSPSDAKPGDLVFFHSTYKTQTPGISHVGIYVGDSVMVHAGNPIGFASIATSYWQSHFYGFARP